MTDEHQDPIDEDDDYVDLEEPADPEGRRIEVDGGDLPKFEPLVPLQRWDTEEGPVVGVPWEGDPVPTAEERVAYVRAAMAVDETGG